jgi:uncharacterized protein
MLHKMLQQDRGARGDGALGDGNMRADGNHRRARGFAAMNPATQREIARKGGQTVSRNREHMAEIGRRGGSSTRGTSSGNE